MERVKILVADDDALQRRLLQVLLEGAGYHVVLARSGEEALAVALGRDAPRILLLDWMMPLPDGPAVCREIRRSAKTPRPYVMLVTARHRREDMLVGLESGADDFVMKPYAPEELLARARVGERVLEATGASSKLVMEALAEALSGPGGEDVVRREEAVGRIFVHQGRVAWAHVSTEPSSLYELLEPDSNVSSEDLRSVLQECKDQKKSLGEVLVAWGFTDRARLRERLRGWIARKLDVILRLPHPSVLFVPEARSFSGDLTYSLDEVLLGAADRPAAPAEPEAVTTRASTPASAWVRVASAAAPEGLDAAKLDGAMSIDGVISAAVLDASTGAYVWQRGEPLDVELGLQLTRLSRMLPAGEAAEEVVLTTATKLHVMRPFPASPGHFLLIAARSAVTSMAMARLQLSAVTGRWSD